MIVNEEEIILTDDLEKVGSKKLNFLNSYEKFE
jgi:hypothetical protein